MSETATVTEATRWTCEKCGASAVITYPAHESVYSVLELLRASHTEESPDCERDLAMIRVVPANE